MLSSSSISFKLIENFRHLKFCRTFCKNVNRGGIDSSANSRGHRYPWHGGIACVCNYLMTQWIDPVLSVARGAQTAYWWWLGQKQKHWLQPGGGWCWHFHPISTAYHHQRKRNFETCLHAEKRRGRKTQRRKTRVSHLFFSDQQASS